MDLGVGRIDVGRTPERLTQDDVAIVALNERASARCLDGPIVSHPFLFSVVRAVTKPRVVGMYYENIMNKVKRRLASIVPSEEFIFEFME